MSKSAVIIKGNPALIDGNERADAFYAELSRFLEELGYRVTLDPGAPYTEPEPADLWIGHSRGADRLRFAPPGTVTIGIGVPDIEGGNPFPVVNHPDDAMAQRTFDGGKLAEGDALPDDANHYVLSPGMQEEIRRILDPK